MGPRPRYSRTIQNFASQNFRIYVFSSVPPFCENGGTPGLPCIYGLTPLVLGQENIKDFDKNKIAGNGCFLCGRGGIRRVARRHSLAPLGIRGVDSQHIPLCEKLKRRKAFQFFKRKGWDSNPRYLSAHTLSRRTD